MVQLSFLLLQVAPLLAFGRVAPFAEDPELVRRAPPTCTIQSVTPPGPPPRGFYCNQQGTVKRPAVLASTPKNTLELCRDSCINGQAGCISFSYGPNKRCITYSKTIVDQGFTKGDTGRAFYNRRCFRKVCSCPSSQTNCGGNCVDLQTDETNCGACGTVVTSGNSCCAGADTNTQTDDANCGACGQAVTQGQTCCSGASTDTQSDNQNCGACGQAVNEGDTCCFGNSIDTQTDPSNCGSCGNSIPQEQTCCSGQGIDLSSDPNNCGACGNVLPEGQSCCSGQGIDVSSDPNNCGACGNVVGQGQTCCNGQAVDLNTDNQNCGSCGNAVPHTCCNGRDTNLADDPNNCGACGVVLQQGQSCCAAVPTDTTSDPNNCGSCGNTCDGSVCYKGICPTCSGDFCAQSADTPCGTGSNCNCVGIEGSTQYGVCTDVNGGTSCEAFSPRCSTNADCPSDKFCGNYQNACNCQRNACFPRNDRCSNSFAASRIFRPQSAQAGAGQLSAKGSA